MSIPAAFPTYLSALLQLWTDKCRGRVLPARRDFCTIDLEPWLSELHLVAVRPEGMRFIVFAAGPASRYGEEMTGRYVSELEPAALADDVERAYQAAVETRAPVLGTQVTQPSAASAAAGRVSSCPSPMTARPSTACWSPCWMTASASARKAARSTR